MAGLEGGSRGFETGNSWAGFEEECQCQEDGGVEGGVEGVSLKRCEASWHSFAAASQRFQDPGRNRNRNARATNRGPRLLRANGQRRRAGHLWILLALRPLSASPH